MNPVVHFELPFDDRDRMADFYNKAFGWKATKYGPEMGDYVVVQTADTDSKGMIKEPGRINGGLYKKSPGKNIPSIVIAVDDIHAAMKKVEEAGGTVTGGSKGKNEPDDIPGVGLYAGITDTEGNKIALLQPARMNRSDGPKPMMDVHA